MITVAVADDQALVRGGFRIMLEQQPDVEVVGEAPDGDAAVRLVAERRPDVMLMDIRMPGTDGLEATRRILSAPGNRTRVLVLTTFDLDEYVVEALRSGASGYLLKDVEPVDLVAAVRQVAAGDLPFARSVLARVVAGYVGGPRRGSDPRLERLTSREREVLVLLGRGLTNQEVCAALYLSLPTVKTHVASILAKLDLRDRVQAAIFAHEQGLVPATDSGRTAPRG